MSTGPRDLPVILIMTLAVAVMTVILYFVMHAAVMNGMLDSNTPNATTSGPPASFEKVG